MVCDAVGSQTVEVEQLVEGHKLERPVEVVVGVYLLILFGLELLNVRAFVKIFVS